MSLYAFMYRGSSATVVDVLEFEPVPPLEPLEVPPPVDDDPPVDDPFVPVAVDVPATVDEPFTVAPGRMGAMVPGAIVD
jgi:hypothetical protein